MRIAHLNPDPNRLTLVRPLTRALGAAGLDVTLLTIRGSEDPAPAGEEYVREIAFPGALIRALPVRGMVDYLNQHGGEFDVIHAHGLGQRTLWHAGRHAQARRIPLVLSPHGMLASRRPGSSARQTWAEALIHRGVLPQVAAWHARSETEAARIEKRGFERPVWIAPAGITAPAPDELATARSYWRERFPLLKDHPTAVFTGLIDLRRGVLELIDLWIAHAPTNWVLVMAGPVGNVSLEQLRHYAFRSLAADRIIIENGERHPSPLGVADLFLQLAERDDHARSLVRALAAGVPGMVVDRAGGGRLPATAGWTYSLAEFGPALRHVLSEPRECFAQRGRSAQAWAIEHHSWQRTAHILADGYHRLCTHAEAHAGK